MSVVFYPEAIAALLKSPQGEVGRSLLKRALKVNSAAKQLCPVDTGRLRSSIVNEMGKDDKGLFVQIGSRVEYAIYVHEGHRAGGGWVAGNPFLRGALNAAGEFGAIAESLGSDAHAAAGNIQFGGEGD